jgi:hypothetical protein
LEEAAGREGKLLWLGNFEKVRFEDSQPEKKMIQDEDGTAALSA